MASGTVTALKGDVKVLQPMKKGLPSMTFEGKSFAYEAATIGMKIQFGHSIFTGPSSGARIIYDEGDTFFISENTLVTLAVKNTKNKELVPSRTAIQIGKLRAIIKPREDADVKIQMKNSVLGVRGTDFFVEQTRANESHIQVLQGSVEVSLKKALPTDLPIKVDQLQKITVHTEETSKPQPLDRTDVLAVAEVSRIPNPPPSEVAQSIEPLLAASQKLVVEEFQRYHAELAKRPEAAANPSQLDLNSLKLIFETTPPPENQKELHPEKSTEDEEVYQKFF